jgi:hypothetical protein
MRALLLAVAAGALLAATPVSAAGIPPNRLADVSSDLVDQVALRVYIHEGRRYCFYFNGWHGPGWYRCGFAFRRGLGWGGVYGWNDWSYGPYERRFGRSHRGSVGFGVQSDTNRSQTTIRSRSSTTTGVAPSGRTQFRSRSTTGSSVEPSGRTQFRSRSTTGSGANVQGGANVQSGSGATVQQRGTSVQGGASVKGSSSGANVQGGASMKEEKRQ